MAIDLGFARRESPLYIGVEFATLAVPIRALCIPRTGRKLPA